MKRGSRQRVANLVPTFPWARRCSNQLRTATAGLLRSKSPIRAGMVSSPRNHMKALWPLFIAFAWPQRRRTGNLARQPATGAFATTRSSDEPEALQHARAHLRKSARCPQPRDARVAVCPREASACRGERSASHSAGVAATAFCSDDSTADKIAAERLRAKRKTAMIV
jgi:hypothetical protein